MKFSTSVCLRFVVLMSAWFSDFLVFSLFSSVVYLVGVARFGWFGLLVLVFSCVHGHDCAIAVLCHGIKAMLGE